MNNKFLITIIIVFALIQAKNIAAFDVEDYIKIAHFENSQEIGIRIGAPILKWEIEKVPEKKIEDTKFNKKEAKWFTYDGLDQSKKAVRIKFRARYRHYENAYVGMVKVYDNAAWVWMNLKVGMKDGKFSYTPHFVRAESDWGGGLLGWFVSVYDAIFKGLGYLITGEGDYPKLTDVVLNIAGSLQLNSLDAQKLDIKDQCFQTIRQSRLFHEKRMDVDNKGVWLIFGYSLPNRNQVQSLINTCL